MRWPLHQHGEAPTGMLKMIGRHATRALSRSSLRPKPRRSVHALVLPAYNKVIEMRRLRLQAVGDTALPGALWIVVILLGVDRDFVVLSAAARQLRVARDHHDARRRADRVDSISSPSPTASVPGRRQRVRRALSCRTGADHDPQMKRGTDLGAALSAQ